MTPPADVAALARQWIEKAEHDRTNARHTMTLTEDCPFDTVCYHAQQCAEKGLKAVLVLNGIDFPHSHDLTALGALLPEAARRAISDDDLILLTPYAVEARNPGPWDPPTREEAQEAIAAADRVRNTAVGLVPPAAEGSA